MTRAGSVFPRCWPRAGGRCWPRSCGPAMPAPITPRIICGCSSWRSSSSRPGRLRGRSSRARIRPAPVTRSPTRVARRGCALRWGTPSTSGCAGRSSRGRSRRGGPRSPLDRQPREGARVAELTGQVALDAWPQDPRLIVRRERPHPGAQLSFTDVDGHRFECFITDQADRDLAGLQTRHRAHASVEDRVRDRKSTGLSNLPFSAFEPNQAWLEAALVAHDLTVWTQQLLFDGEHAVCEPKRLRYRLLHVAGRLPRHARRLTLHLPADWPWAAAVTTAFKRLAALPS